MVEIGWTNHVVVFDSKLYGRIDLLNDLVVVQLEIVFELSIRGIHVVLIDQPVTPHTLLVKGCNCECVFNRIQVLKEEIVAFHDELIGFFFHDCSRERVSVQAFFSLKRSGFHFHVQISVTLRYKNFEVASFAHDQRFLCESIHSFYQGKVHSPKDDKLDS